MEPMESSTKTAGSIKRKRPSINYKYCIVPLCKNTSVKTPEKLFFNLSKSPAVRLDWIAAINAGCKSSLSVSEKSTHHVCEDHFNLEEDVGSWPTARKIFKLGDEDHPEIAEYEDFSATSLKLKPSVVPHIFLTEEELTGEDTTSNPVTERELPNLVHVSRIPKYVQVIATGHSSKTSTNYNTVPSPHDNSGSSSKTFDTTSKSSNIRYPEAVTIEGGHEVTKQVHQSLNIRPGIKTRGGTGLFRAIGVRHSSLTSQTDPSLKVTGHPASLGFESQNTSQGRGRVAHGILSSSLSKRGSLSVNSIVSAQRRGGYAGTRVPVWHGYTAEKQGESDLNLLNETSNRQIKSSSASSNFLHLKPSTSTSHGDQSSSGTSKPLKDSYFTVKDSHTLQKGSLVSQAVHNLLKTKSTTLRPENADTQSPKKKETPQKLPSSPESQQSVLSSPTRKEGNASTQSSQALPSSQSDSIDSDLQQEILEMEESDFVASCKEVTFKLMERYPKQFYGVDPEKQFVIDSLTKCVKSKMETHVLLTLRKVKLCESHFILGKYFGLSESQVSRIFSTTLPQLSCQLKKLIFKPPPDIVLLNLPVAFRKNYSDTSDIIDCFEIAIEKPSDPVLQALTYSSYKKCNTIKYLISCTPDGHINFISDGYGGKISDVALVRESGFLNTLTPGSKILADRGFKHLEKDFREIQCVLIRPPSVGANEILSADQSREAKTISGLRIHVERVIGRVREFKMIAPHHAVEFQLVRLLDDVVCVAAGLTNLQGKLTRC